MTAVTNEGNIQNRSAVKRLITALVAGALSQSTYGGETNALGGRGNAQSTGESEESATAFNISELQLLREQVNNRNWTQLIYELTPLRDRYEDRNIAEDSTDTSRGENLSDRLNPGHTQDGSWSTHYDTSAQSEASDVGDQTNGVSNDQNRAYAPVKASSASMSEPFLVSLLKRVLGHFFE